MLQGPYLKLSIILLLNPLAQIGHSPYFYSIGVPYAKRFLIHLPRICRYADLQRVGKLLRANNFAHAQPYRM